jgi:hypothetical protein
MMTGKTPSETTWETARSIWSNVFSMFAGMTNTSPASQSASSSSRSTPRSRL